MTSNQVIIAFTGQKGSGKNTAANFLIDKINSFKSEPKTYIEMSLAAGLKDAVKDIFDIEVTDENKDKPIEEEWGKITPRDMVITLGDAVRKLKKDAITIAFKNKLQKIKHDIIIITDVRYNQEADMLTKLGAKIIKIERLNNIPSCFDIFCKHSSERGINPKYLSEIIYNTRSLSYFRREIENHYERIITPSS